MTTLTPGLSPASSSPPRSSHSVRYAWVSLALIPVALVVADGVLHGILSLLGIDQGAEAEETPTLLQALVAGVPYVGVMLIPAAGGFMFGTRAVREGDRHGRLPRALALVVGALVVVSALIFLVLGIRG